MEMKLLSLDIRNFKGIKEEHFSFGGEDYEIFGGNATGKTSVFDALSWLLFGKNSEDSTTFSIKPVDMQGEKVVGVIPEVTALFDIDGTEVELKKRLDEEWRKKSGESEKSYDGDTVSAFIDGVPKKIDREYNEYIKSLADETILKIGLYHRFFMDMHYKDKRNVLLSLTQKNPDEILKARPEFEGVDALLKGQSIEDAKKRLQEEKRRTKQEYDGIPARIDELKKTVVTLDERDISKAEKELTLLTKKREEINKAILALQKGNGEQSALLTELASLKKAQANKAYEITSVFNEAQNKIGVALRKAVMEKAEVESEIQRINNAIEERQSNVDSIEEDLIRSREEWQQEYAKTFQPKEDQEKACPYCKQDLPHETIEAAKMAAEELFNAQKVEALAKLEDRGKSLKTLLGVGKEKIESLLLEQEEKEKEYTTLTAEVARWEEEKNLLAKQEPNLEKIPELQEYSAMIQTLEKTLESYSVEEEVNRYNLDLNNISEEEREIQKTLSQVDITKRTEERIKELEASYKTTGKALLQIEVYLETLDQFNSQRCRLLEDEINEHFSTVRWKLFEIQKNGGIKDVCTATVDGVDYGDLNNAAKINAGIEASSVVTKANGATVPLFIDNAESIIQVTKREGQTIYLTVHDTKALEYRKANEIRRLWAI
ncbi:MAG: AAA family ATPase [Clostridiales bacterium]|nr:AAA family ATPase [Clostridiales bacterium]